MATFYVFYSFKEDSSLCVAAVLNEYLKRLEKWRTSDECQLLLSFVQPRKPVVSSTISGWIKKGLTISELTQMSLRDIQPIQPQHQKLHYQDFQCLKSQKEVTGVILQHGKSFIIGKLSYLQRDFKSQFLINSFGQGVGSGLEYYLRAEVIECSIQCYGDFMK